MKTVPFSEAEIRELTRSDPTPLYVYDEQGIRAVVRRMKKAFAWNAGYQNYFAIKALPNPAILKVLKEEGMGMDASSLGELFLAEKAGCIGDDIFMTSNNTPAEEFVKAKELGAVINFDDISHIDYFLEHAGSLPDMAAMRYNPGATKQGNSIIGNPVEAKYGATKGQLFEAYAKLRDGGVKKFGLHTMVASNKLSADYFVETARLLFEVAVEIWKKLGITFEVINLGGGFGIPYRPEEKELPLEQVAEGIREQYERVLLGGGHPPCRVVTECGRYVTGPHGYLVSAVRHTKNTYKTYIGLDASMSNLMRPGMYGAYHHITVLGKENVEPNVMCDVTGSLCENNDKFAVDRLLPPVVIGDLVVIHDAGAHGHSMGFQYNAKLRSAEFLYHGGTGMGEAGAFTKIRRAETLEDYFATLV